MSTCVTECESECGEREGGVFVAALQLLTALAVATVATCRCTSARCTSTSCSNAGQGLLRGNEENARPDDVGVGTTAQRAAAAEGSMQRGPKRRNGRTPSPAPRRQEAQVRGPTAGRANQPDDRTLPTRRHPKKPRRTRAFSRCMAARWNATSLEEARLPLTVTRRRRCCSSKWSSASMRCS